ncbi:MAG: LiaI-LiaF-like domain-containing protein [bacterium]
MKSEKDHNPGYHLRFSGRLLIGLMFILVGALVVLNNAGVVHIGDPWKLWPLILIWVGLSKMTRPVWAPGRIFGAFLFVLGVGFLLGNFGYLHFDWNYVWPLILVAFGLNLVLRALHHSDLAIPGVATAVTAAGGSIAGGEAASSFEAFAFLSGVDRRVTSQDFRKGEATAIMGGCEIDLRGADIVSGEAVIETFAFMGGIEITVPRDWTVVSEGVAILGAFTDSREHAPGSPASPQKRLVIRGHAIMGAVEIKN